MKVKMIASILAITMLSAVMCMAADDDDEKKRQKTRKMSAEALQEEELEAHGELNQVNLLLHDFARELLKQRLQLRVRFVRLVESSRLE